MNILISVNKNFINPAKVMLLSLSKNCKEKINVYIMNNNLLSKDVDKLCKYIEKECNGFANEIKMNSELLKNMPIKSSGGQFFGIEAYNRLLCQYFLPNNMKKILYLDSDVVINGDIQGLYNIPFENRCYIASLDFAGIKFGENQRLGLPYQNTYVNSGVLLINLEKLRNMKLESFINEAKKYKDKIIYPDQDLLNLMYKNQIKIVSSKYNFIVKDDEYIKISAEDRKKIKIYHYAGKDKPWKICGGKNKLIFLKPYYRMLLLQKKYVNLLCLCCSHIIYKIIRKLKCVCKGIGYEKNK